MSDLNQKFTTVESQLTLQHTQLLAKLDSILNILGTPPATGTTLADLAAILNQIRGDNTAILQQLSGVKSNQVSTFDEIRKLATEATLGDVDLRLTNLAAIVYNQAIGDRRFIGDNADSSHSILWHIARLDAALGTPTGDATTTLLGLLASLQYGSQYQATGAPPSSTASCAKVVENSGLTFNDAITVWAQWRNLPPEIATVEQPPVPTDAAIFPVGQGWNDAKIWVQSNAPNWQMRTAGAAFAFPTNQWTPLGINSYSFAVGVRAENNLKCFLCLDAASTSFLFTAKPYTDANNTNGFAIRWNDGLGLAGSTQAGGRPDVNNNFYFLPNPALGQALTLTRYSNTVTSYGGRSGSWAGGESNTISEVFTAGLLVFSSQPFQLLVAVGTQG